MSGSGDAPTADKSTGKVHIGNKSKKRSSRLDKKVFAKMALEMLIKSRFNNDNKMERLGREIRDREKTKRGLKKRRTPLLDGFQTILQFRSPTHGTISKH